MSGKRSPLSYRLMLFLLVCTKSATTRRLTRFFLRNLCIRCPNPSGPFGTARSCSSFTLHHPAFFFWQGRMESGQLLEGQNLMRCRYATPLYEREGGVEPPMRLISRLMASHPSPCLLALQRRVARYTIPAYVVRSAYTVIVATAVSPSFPYCAITRNTV